MATVRFIVKTIAAVAVPAVTIRVLDGSGVLVNSGTTNAYGVLDLELSTGTYTVWYYRNGYARPSSVALEVPASAVVLDSGWPSPIVADQPVVLVGSGFDATAADNTVVFSTETGTVEKDGATVSAGRDVLVVIAPSAVELGAVVATSVFVRKDNPSPPPTELESNTITVDL